MFFTTAALSASVQVKHIFPVQFTDLAQTEGLQFFIFNVTSDDGLFPFKGFQENIRRSSQKVQMLGTGDIDQETQDGGYVQPIGDLIGNKHLLSTHLIQVKPSHQQRRNREDPLVVKSPDFNGQLGLQSINELESHNDQAGEQNDQIGVLAHGQVARTLQGPSVDCVSESYQDKSGQNIGQE